MNDEMFVENGAILTQETKASDTILLIGDSIRIGYCYTVRDELKDTAEVIFPPENCRHTHHVLTMLQTWSTLCPPEQVKAVLFNCGHWDVAHWGGDELSLTPVASYTDNIQRIFNRLKEIYPNAVVAFATTTPMNPNGSQGANPRTNDEIRQYNDAAVSVLQQRGARIIDLYDKAKDWDASHYQDYCHYTPDAFAQLGRIVADEIKSMFTT